MSKLENFYNIDSAILECPNSDVRKLGGTQYLTIGTLNNYPTELIKLFKSVPTLRTLIEGSAMMSSSLFSAPFNFNFNKLFMNLYTHGWCPVLVRQSRDHKSFFLTALDPRFVRTNADESMYCYSEQDSFRSKVEYPAFESGVDGSSILAVKLNDLESPYALPLWSSALREVQILSKVSEYHNASLDNGFMGSYLINFNNGMPDPESKREIENLVNKKFAGSNNAGRIMISFNNSKEDEASLTSLSTEDTSARYGDLVKSCKEALFTSFRGSSQLFGAPDGSESALTETEYAYKLALFVKFNIEPITSIVLKSLNQFGVTRVDPMTIVEDINTAANNE